MVNNSLNQKSYQLLVDVSVIFESDSKTGIQRVVRALLRQLISSPPIGYEICPVYATPDHAYRYVREESNPAIYKESDVIVVNAGDVFLGLDLTAHLLPRYKKQLRAWKAKGVSVHIMVYDILPLTHPQWFRFRTYLNFRKWIKVLVNFSDSAICISHHGRAELMGYLSHRFKHADQLKVSVITLGADIEASFPSEGLPENVEKIFLEIAKRPTILMVGTIEPRKGYLQTLLAFEQLWQQSCNVNLVIIGRSGWKTDLLQQKIRSHPQNNARLWWFEDGSDELLKRLYNVASGVIVSSEAEGFGLPLVESILHGLPVLARDISVFREVAGDAVTYFDSNDPYSLSLSITDWLSGINSGDVQSQCIPVTSWHESAKQLCRSLGLVQSEDNLAPTDDRTLDDRKSAFVTANRKTEPKKTFLKRLFSLKNDA